MSDWKQKNLANQRNQKQKADANRALDTENMIDSIEDHRSLSVFTMSSTQEKDDNITRCERPLGNRMVASGKAPVVYADEEDDKRNSTEHSTRPLTVEFAGTTFRVTDENDIVSSPFASESRPLTVEMAGTTFRVTDENDIVSSPFASECDLCCDSPRQPPPPEDLFAIGYNGNWSGMDSVDFVTCDYLMSDKFQAFLKQRRTEQPNGDGGQELCLWRVQSTVNPREVVDVDDERKQKRMPLYILKEVFHANANASSLRSYFWINGTTRRICIPPWIRSETERQEYKTNAIAMIRSLGANHLKGSYRIHGS